MRIPLYQVDAFAGALFSGNPAAVCPLGRWLNDRILQAIAAENNLAETAFYVKRGDAWDLRWFTPTREVDLCGHATLATAWVIFHRRRRAPREGGSGERVTFRSKSGVLNVTRKDDQLELDFPAWRAAPCEPPAALVEGLGASPREVLRTRDYLAVFESEDQVRALAPRMEPLAALDALGVIATAPGRGVGGEGSPDYVLRFFAPGAGIPEDPATGSAHSTLAPFWAARFGRARLSARQLSPRGGEFWCEVRGERVAIAGRVVPYLEGTIEVPD